MYNPAFIEAYHLLLTALHFAALMAVPDIPLPLPRPWAKLNFKTLSVKIKVLKTSKPPMVWCPGVKGTWKLYYFVAFLVQNYCLNLFFLLSNNQSSKKWHSGVR